MPCLNIQLPGNGSTAPLFCFDSQQPMAHRLMNLPLLASTDSDTAKEQWLVHGPCSSQEIGHSQHKVLIHSSPHYQLLSANIAVGAGCIRSLTQQVYQQLLEQVVKSDFPQLIRCWNYVPNINHGSGDNEVYRQFCWGRADALAQYQFALPAATGIGSADGWLRVAILCTSADTQVAHWENPRQLSAYAYPRQYGPRSPSFARATSIGRDGESLLLLSGTSSIVQHQTQHSGDLAAQTAETRRNIDHLLAAYQEQHPQQLKPHAVRFYLRNPAQLDQARTCYARHFGGYPEPSFLAADICRADLTMEVEATFS